MDRWLNDLSPSKRELVARFVSASIEVRGPMLLGTPLPKSLGSGLCELRIRGRLTGVGQDALLRVFVHFHGSQQVLILGGYDKGRDPSKRRQQREIATARGRLRGFGKQ
ncbi:MAG: hypothetical protein EXQ60_07905 [Candidatus Nanopelagicales bacterium]|nr:hypothetical protein [Candidatus Nanopelagicales bacterium]